MSYQNYVYIVSPSSNPNDTGPRSRDEPVGISYLLRARICPVTGPNSGPWSFSQEELANQVLAPSPAPEPGPVAQLEPE